MQASLTVPLLFARMSIAALPELQISKHSSTGAMAGTARHLLKRNGTVETNVAEVLTDSSGGGYFMDSKTGQVVSHRIVLTLPNAVTVGTPPQSQEILLDTASSDTYFMTSSACQTLSSTSNPCRGGSFSPRDSSGYTIIEPSPGFNTSFGDGSTAVGPFARDTIDIGGLVIDNVEFGVVEEASTTTGFTTGQLGLGYSSNEATTQQYPNLPEVLVDSGAINSRLYSIYLNEFSASGSVLFGGIDSSKYSGELVSLDLIPQPGTTEISQFITTVTALAVSLGSSGPPETILSGGLPLNLDSQRNDSALPVLLCVGCGSWQVPQDYYNLLINSSFTFVDPSGTCSCNHRNDDHMLQIVFGAKTVITVPARDLIVPYYSVTTGAPVTYTDGSDACAFMITPGSAQYGFYTIGESILRSMYIVFDLDNAQVSIAQAVINSTAPSDVHTVAAGPSGVAEAASRVQPATANAYSIASAASVDVSFSTSAASTTASVSASTASAGTLSATNGVRTTGTSSAASTPSPSKGAGVRTVLRAEGRIYLWMSIIVTFTMAFATGLIW